MDTQYIYKSIPYIQTSDNYKDLTPTEVLDIFIPYITLEGGREKKKKPTYIAILNEYPPDT